MITSPPYGDNTSTVPYGQQAYLPLQWIDICDIGDDITADFLETTYTIDRRSLGGIKRRGDYSEMYGDLLSRSPSLVSVVDSLSSKPRDRLTRVLAFLYDFDVAAASAARAMSPNAYSFWTLGNRRVGSYEIPFHAICRELFRSHDLVYVTGITRRIPMKRMAVRNSIATTMRQERILVFRRGQPGESG
jgi:hypothetical protein